MIFYLRFWRSYERLVAKNEFFKKRLEDSNINLAKLQEMQAQRKKEIAENNLAVQAKIRDPESKLEAAQIISESVRKDHSVIHVKFISVEGYKGPLPSQEIRCNGEMGLQEGPRSGSVRVPSLVGAAGPVGAPGKVMPSILGRYE
jgi:hypothetical protein